MRNRFKHFLIVIFVSLVAGPFLQVNAQTNGTPQSNDKIHFIEDAWKEALKQAAAQKKYIFVDAYATWCGPCKMLKSPYFYRCQGSCFL